MKKSCQIFCVRHNYLIKSCRQIWLHVNQPFILFILLYFLYFYYKALFAYRTNLGELSFALFKPIISVFHNFARQIALIQYSRRSTRFPCTINYRIDHITERFHEENSKNVGTVQSDQSAPVQYAG